MIREAYRAGIRVTKSYPYGVTTHSENGIRDFPHLYPVYRESARLGMINQFHAELDGVSILTRERVFLERVARPLIQAIPDLKVVIEHITTGSAARFVEEAPDSVAATLTVHHLDVILDDVYGRGGKIRPHLFCLPPPKPKANRTALWRAALSGNPKFFLGLDCAPHFVTDKECAKGCGGLFTTPVAIPTLVEFYCHHRAAHRLEDFVSQFGPGFYGLPIPSQKMTLVKKPWQVPERYFGCVVPYRAGEWLEWQLATA